MLKISREQFYSRLDILPENLRQVFFSQDASDQVFDICQAEHLSEEKSGVVAQLVGDIIMGFVHREDLPKEIQRELGVDIKVGESVFDEINKKVLFSVQNDIDKFYSPIAPSADKSTQTQIEKDINDVVNLKAPEIKTEEAPKLFTGAPTQPEPIIPHAEPIKDMKVSSTSFELKDVSAKPLESSKKPASLQLTSNPTENSAEDVPHILHKIDDPNIAKSQKTSFGGFFGLLKKNTTSGPSVRDNSVMANVIIANQKPGLFKSAKQEMPQIKIVNYSLSEPEVKNSNTFGESANPNSIQNPPSASAESSSNPELSITPRVVSFDVIQKDNNSVNINPGIVNDLKFSTGRQNFEMDQSQTKENSVPEQLTSVQAIETKPESQPQAPTPSPESLELKDIPVEEDIVDLRRI